MKHSYRQEVFNVLLAQLLQERGIVSAPEDVLKATPSSARKMPDVLVDYSGLRIAIEGEVDDQPNYGEKALDSAKRRVEQGLAHIGVAIIYPATLRKVDFARLKAEMEAIEFRIAIVSEAETEPQYRQGTVDGLGEVLRRTFGELVKEDVVAQAVKELEEGIAVFAEAVVDDEGNVVRLAQVLGIKGLPKRNKPSDEKEAD